MITDITRKAEAALGVRFRDRRLLLQALVHRSYLNEVPADAVDFPTVSNERLEFLGDAVLGCVIADYLYSTFPETPEGTLTTLRAGLVRAETIAQAARRLGLGQFLYLTRGERDPDARNRTTFLAPAYEAVVGAIYLDQSIDAARAFILRTLTAALPPPEAGAARPITFADPKSRLQQLTQIATGTPPAYVVVEETGPEHARRFLVEARLGARVLAAGEGSNKQDAEQDAARRAIELWPVERAAAERR